MDADIKYDIQAIELLRNAAQNEYSNEHERTATIDSKAGIALPIISAYFLALAQMNDFKSIMVVTVSDIMSVLIPVMTIITYSTALAFALIAVVWMARVVFTRPYCKINPRDLYTDDYLKNDSRVLSVKFIQLYLEAIEHNRLENDVRVKLYQRSWLFTFISVICFVTYIIMNNNIL